MLNFVESKNLTGAFATPELIFDDNIRGDFVFKTSRTVSNTVHFMGVPRSSLLARSAHYKRLYYSKHAPQFLVLLKRMNRVQVFESAPILEWRITNIPNNLIQSMADGLTNSPKLQNNSELLPLPDVQPSTTNEAESKEHLEGGLRLFETSPKEEMNFGDILTRHIFREVFGIQTTYSKLEDCDIIGVGSLLEYYMRLHDPRRPVYIWGSGFIFDDTTMLDFKDAHIALLRGKLSLARIKNIPEGQFIPLGDPGLIVSKLVEPRPVKNYKLGVIPHQYELDIEALNVLANMDGVRIISPIGHPIEVLNEIASCENILSSSLHGLITADSFEIPNVHISLTHRLEGGSYKFRDYYSIFEESRHYTVGLQDVLGRPLEEIIDIIHAHYKVPRDLEVIKQQIIESMPEQL
jgi:hypothetical protein